jgi:energy-coupling factor transporter ATP-binding protein EcfA2
MYLTFFGLNEKPFAITPDPRYLYLSERHAEALAHLLYGINEAGGFVQLTGEVGTGKTTIVRSLLAQTPKNAEIALILNPKMTAPEFLLTICEELGIGVPDSALGSHVRGKTPFIPIGKEPPAQLIVDPPNSQALAVGVVLIQYRAENVHIVAVFGPAAVNVFPRVGHLHINVDDLPWHWADASDTGTIDIKDLPPGQHTVRIDLVDGNHQLFPGQPKTVTVTVPNTASHSH